MNQSSRYKTLREYVESHTKTQGDIARELEISDSMLSMYLSGQRFPSRETALRIAKRTGVPLESLLSPEEMSA